jgi:hypothetical protein
MAKHMGFDREYDQLYDHEKNNTNERRAESYNPGGTLALCYIVLLLLLALVSDRGGLTLCWSRVGL